MRAVNLVPAERRSGAGGAGGRSGGMVYVFLAALAAILMSVSVYALAARDESRATKELAAIEASTQQYQAAAQRYATYEAAASKASARIAAIKGLADARFDWAGAMRDLSRVVPKTAQITQMDASVRPSAGGSGAAGMRGAMDVPALSINGCSETQDTVADLVTKLQAMRRVTNVTLENSTRSDPTVDDDGKLRTEPAGDAPSGDGTCTVDSPNPYQFVLVVFYAPGTSRASADAVPGTTPAATLPGADPAAQVTDPAPATTPNTAPAE